MPNEDFDGLFPELTNILNAFDATQPPANGHDPLASDPEHGGMTAEQIDAFFMQNPAMRPLPPLLPNQQHVGPQFKSGVSAQPPVGGIEDQGGGIVPGTETHAPTAPPPSTPAGPPASFQPPAPPAPVAPTQGQPAPSGTPFDPQELAQLQAIRDQLRADPELRSKIADHFVGRTAPQVVGPRTAPTDPSVQPIAPPAPFQPAIQPQQPFQTSTPPGVPAGLDQLDLEDPAIKFLWDTIQGQQAEIQRTRQTVEQTQQLTAQQVSQQVNDQYEVAAKGFKTKYELEDKDLTHLSEVAARMGVMPQLLSGVDPLTGLPVRPDVIAAVDRALEIAYFTDPTYRQREWERQGKQRRSDAQRQQRLAAVSGSPASVPRTSPAPTTAEGRKDAMLGEVASMLRGDWSEPVAN